jgi:DNA-binding transcriptional MerR regulator
MAKSLTQISLDFGMPETPVSIVRERAPRLKKDPPAPVMEKEKPSPQVKEKTSSRPASKRGRPSLKSITEKADLIDIPEDDILFKKQYYSIGDVARMFKENQSLIRYWETEFDILQPRKNRKGDRFFRPIDIKNLVLIYDLLRRRKFTIEGAKDFLRKNKNAKPGAEPLDEKFQAIQSLTRIRAFLLELRANL